MKKRVRFEAEPTPTSMEALACRGAPTESIKLEEYLFTTSQTPPTPSSSSLVDHLVQAFPLRLHLGVLRSSHTYHACVLITASFAFTIDSVVPNGCESTAQLTAFVRNSPAEKIPDVCILAEPKTTTLASTSSSSPSAEMLHFLITPKEQGLFSYNLKLPVHNMAESTRSCGHLEVKIIGNSLDVNTGKPSIREGVRVFVTRDPDLDSAA